MSYARNTEAMGCCEPKEMHGMMRPEVPSEPLVELMGGTKDVGLAIVNMVEKIDIYLFGSGNDSCCENKEASPMCFRAALEQHRRTLCDAADTLSRICNMLGV